MPVKFAKYQFTNKQKQQYMLKISIHFKKNANFIGE